MKKSLFLGLIGALALFVSCVHDIQEVVPMIRGGLTLTAVTEQPAATRTAVESGTQVWWEPGDSIKVFCGSQAACFVSDLSERVAQADFVLAQKGFTIGETDSLWALYPYAEEAVFDGQAVTTTLPSTQVARAGSFGKNINLSLARTTGRTLQFYNVGGGIRFTVTEEGIRKVIFEGLGGESISGKVKIGFDESGIPVVQEVVGGSQFITLLPPEGEDAFQKDTWYYLVAIPGALEKGYKLRFYKDTDYARKVSEKVAQIKRSIYGSIEKADMGIEYEATTTHFPETGEEIEVAISMVSEITHTIEPIIEKCSSILSLEEMSLSIAKEIKHVDGVISSDITESGNIYFITRDSVYVNIPIAQFDKQSSTWGNCLQPFPSPLYQEHSIDRHRSNATLPNDKKALALFPRYDEAMRAFNWSEYGKNIYAGFISSLESCGYEVDPYYNDEATLDLFRGKNWEKYDIIYFNTHGQKDLMTARNGVPTTSFMTSSLVEDKWGPFDDFNQLFGFLSLCIWENETYYWITTQAIEHDKPSFKNSWIFAHSCYSAAHGDVAEYCLANGAAGYSGFLEPASKLGSAELVSNMLFAFSCGMSFEKAETWAKSNSFNQGTETIVSDASFFKCDQREDVEALYIVNPTPYNLKSSVDGSSVSFSWEKRKTNGYYEYSLCIDGKRLGKQFFSNHDYSSCTASYTVLTPGDHTWSVIANLIINGRTEASFKSQDECFTVVGVPVESISLDNTELELSIGCTATITATVLPENATNKTVTWSSSDETVATVSSTGLVTGLAVGSAVITVTTADGDKTATCNVTVSRNGQPDNEIWYTTSNGQIMTHEYDYATFDVGANLVSHVYENGKGVMTFDRVVSKIGASAFMYCTNLETITLPGYVERIEDNGFYGCHNLTQMEIPKTVTRIGLNVFGDCGSLSSLSVSSDNPVYDSRGNCNAIIHTESNSLIAGCVNTVIPFGVKEIAGSAFEVCSGLTRITIPESVVSIGRAAFASCSNLSDITIPDSVTSIGEVAFGYCASLKDIALPKGLNRLEYASFYYCTGLEKIVIPDGVKSIGKQAFCYCSNLSKVIMSEGITSIGEQAFKQCTVLTDLEIPQSVTIIDSAAFNSCRSLIEIKIVGSTSIGASAFGSCSGLTKVLLSEKVTSVRQRAFSGCKALTSIISLSPVPPGGGNRMFYSTNDCPIYVPAGSVEAYKTAEYWSEYADRIIPLSSGTGGDIEGTEREPWN